ncbi:hypothetical protein [Nocardiopsis sp. CC223A]|uniref:hypothetical protein n=1 Tax=Nocardiopsis sp. CC223A TaxID=3044051 RepID=UPI00278C3C95|nr:hypothetical protein [Nocardiopsis sp. CC223A]
MDIDLDRATAFMAGHARLLDRRRFEHLVRPTEHTGPAILAALDAYRNPDGGHGHGLEPDLRSPESQPGGALHALEAMADAAPATYPHAPALLDRLGAATLPDGGLPFALPVTDPAACAPFWVSADPAASSLQITAAVTAQAHRAARTDPRVADHPWLATATEYCLGEIAAIEEAPFAYVLSFALGFLDAVVDTRPEAAGLLRRLARFVPADGRVPVAGGAAGETLHPLDYAAAPGRPIREHLDAGAVAADLDRLERGQRPDGGWTVDFTSHSPAAALEWRGYTTVSAVAALRANGR